MKGLITRFRWKGFLAVLGILVALFLLFAIFGNFPDKYTYGSDPGIAKVNTTSSNYLKYGQAATAAQAPAVPGNYTAMDDASYEGVGYDRDAVKMEFSEEIGDPGVPYDRKIIKEGSAYVETKDFDHSMSVIDQMIAQSGGFTEKKNIRGNSYNADDLRFATIVFRVPAQHFESIMENMGTVGVVTYSNTSGTDITDQYIDSETRLRNLKVQEDTLLDILARAEKLEDVITLEARISDVRYQIETIENQLKNYDRLVQYSRITVELAEVVEPTQKTPVARTLGARMSTAFRSAIDSFVDELENFVVWLVYNWILLSVIIVVTVLIVVILKARKKRKKSITPAVTEAEGQDREKLQDSGNQQ